VNLSPNFTALSVPLSRTAPNFAPAKPIADAIQNKKLNDAKSATGFEKAIRERYNYYLKHEKISWDEAISAGQLVSMFINGDQLLQRRPYGPGYYVRPLANDDTYRQTAMNMMRFYYQCCETKMISSNPTVAMRAGGDQPIDIAAAQAARPVVDYWESQFYTAKFSRREALYAATNGLFIHRVRWNPFKGECMAQSQSVGQQNLQIDDGLGECAECQHQGPAADFPATQFGNQCANCGSAAVDVRPPQQQSMSQVSIGPAMPVGEPEIIQCPFAAWRWDLSKELEDSSWAIYRQRITQGAIKLILGDAVLPDSESSDYRGLDILHALAYGGQAFGGAPLRYDTPIATLNGWAEIGDLQPGDTVFADDGKPCNVISHSGLMFERPCYEVEFSDGSIIVTDEDHLWNTFTQSERAQFNTHTTKFRQHRHQRRSGQLIPNGGKRPDNSIRMLASLNNELPDPTGTTRTTLQIRQSLRKGRRYNHYIRATKPLELPDTYLPIDPYLAGLWLGDGSSDGGGYTTADRELVEAFEEASFQVTSRWQPNRPYGFYVKGLRVKLREAGILNNKHIPPEYLRSSPGQRLALLQGLMDTDGYCDKDGKCEFSNTNPRLRDDFMELTASLGIKTRCLYRPPSKRIFPGGVERECQESWRIGFITDTPVFRLRRKLQRQKTKCRESQHWHTIVDIRPTKSAPVCCIGVDSPSHLYLAGRAMIPTHNTITSGERRNSDKRPTMAEFWMSEEDYAGIDLEEGKTVSGHTIPGGKMREHFKGPICVVGLNDMSLVVGVYQNESHKTEVVTGQWFMKSDSGAGRGMQDAASVQRRFNAVDGQVYQGLAGTATPAVMTDLRILKEDQSGYLFKPNTTIDVNLSMLPPGMGLRDAVYLGTPGNVNQQYIQYGSVFLKDMFQVSSLVTEFSDFMSIDNRTATGAQITAALANSLFGPMLLTKGEARVRIAKILVQLCAKYGQVPRYFPGKGAARGRTVGGAELKGKVIYELEQNSELPATPYTQQTDIRVLLETMGGIQGLLMLKQADPPLFRSFVAPFNVKLESEDSDMVATICLTRLEQMESNLQMGVNDPQMLVQSLRPPVSVVEPKHKEKAEWWSDFLDLDTGMSAPPEIRAAAEAMYYLHQNLDAQKSMPQAANQGLVAGIGQAATGAPSALGAQALQPEDTSGQEQQAEHEHEAQLHAKTQEMDLQKASLQAKTQMTVAQIQGDNAITAAKITAKSRAHKDRLAATKKRVKGKAA
jgi:hypothetical protein